MWSSELEAPSALLSSLALRIAKSFLLVGSKAAALAATCCSY
jgi:hypothetical protein